MNSQQVAATRQAYNDIKNGKRVPFAMLFPVIEPLLDKDKAMQLRILYNRLKKNKISKDGFVKHMRSLVGDHMLKMAALKLEEELGARLSSNTPSVGPETIAKPPMKKAIIGVKKPLESPAPEFVQPTKKQKVFHSDQSIEQLNDVTAVSRIKLREEEEQLFSGPKEDSRVSEEPHRVVQEEEILQPDGNTGTDGDKEKDDTHAKPAKANKAEADKMRTTAANVAARAAAGGDDMLSKWQLMAEAWLKHGGVDSAASSQPSKDINRKLVSTPANKAEDDKMRTTAANVAARAAVGGDDMLSKWQLLAEAYLKRGGVDSAASSQPSKEINRKLVSTPAIRAEDEKMRTTAANVAARAAVGGDDILSKWQLMAEAYLKRGGVNSAASSQPSKEINRKLVSTPVRSARDNQDGEKWSQLATVATSTALSQGSNLNSGQLFPPWQTSCQNENSICPSHQVANVSQQEQHASMKELNQLGSASENQLQQQIDSSKELNCIPGQHKQSQDKFPQQHLEEQAPRSSQVAPTQVVSQSQVPSQQQHMKMPAVGSKQFSGPSLAIRALTDSSNMEMDNNAHILHDIKQSHKQQPQNMQVKLQAKVDKLMKEKIDLGNRLKLALMEVESLTAGKSSWDKERTALGDKLKSWIARAVKAESFNSELASKLQTCEAIFKAKVEELQFINSTEFKKLQMELEEVCPDSVKGMGECFPSLQDGLSVQTSLWHME